MKLLPFFAVLSALFSATARGASPTGSILVTTPQRYSVSLGISSVEWARSFGTSSGYVVRAEPGLSGGKFHIGIRSAFSLAFLPVATVDVTGALFQTWNDPWGGVKAGQTYAGMEYRMGFRMVLVTAGYYRHIAGDDPGNEWITSLGAGVGL